MRDMQRHEERGACMDAVKPKMYSEFQECSKIPSSIRNDFSHMESHIGMADMPYIGDPWFHMENSFLMENGIFLNLL